MSTKQQQKLKEVKNNLTSGASKEKPVTETIKLEMSLSYGKHSPSLKKQIKKHGLKFGKRTIRLYEMLRQLILIANEQNLFSNEVVMQLFSDLNDDLVLYLVKKNYSKKYNISKVEKIVNG